MDQLDVVFASREEAERAHRALREAGIPEDRLVVLVPGAVPDEAAPVGARESTGVGAAVGGAAGATALLATGVQTGVFASLLVPGVGPVLAIGVLAAGILGVSGAAVGAAIGASAEAALRSEDDAPGWLFHYEEALRAGRSIVVVLPRDEAEAARARAALEAAARGEPMRAVRERWWQERAAQLGEASPLFRRGFEAAQGRDVRGRDWDEARPLLAGRQAEVDATEFRRGYEAGLAYRRRLAAAAEGA